MGIKEDTGGGCSICGTKPAVNIEGTYWLCDSCVAERLELGGSSPVHNRVMWFWNKLRCVIAYPILLIFDILICWTLSESFKDLREDSNGKLEQLWNKQST